MKYRIVLCLWTAMLMMAMMAGCARGDVAEYGVDTGETITPDARTSDLYEDDDLIPEEVEQGVEDIREGIDRGPENPDEDFTEDTLPKDEEPKRSPMTGQEM